MVGLEVDGGRDEPVVGSAAEIGLILRALEHLMPLPGVVVVVGIDDLIEIEGILGVEGLGVGGFNAAAVAHGIGVGRLTALRAVDGCDGIDIVAKLVGELFAQATVLRRGGHGDGARIAHHIVGERAHIAVVDTTLGRTPGDGGLSAGGDGEARRSGRQGLVEANILRLAHHGGSTGLVGDLKTEIGRALADAHGCADLLAGRGRAGGDGTLVGLDGVADRPRQRSATIGLGRNRETDRSGGGTTVEGDTEVSDGCRSGSWRRGIGDAHAEDLLVVGHIGDEGSGSRGEIDGVEGRMLVLVDAGPVEDVVVLVDLTALAVALARTLGHADARGADQTLLASLGVDTVEVAIGGHTIDNLVGGDAEGDILVLRLGDGGALHGVVVDDAKLKAAEGIVVELAIDLARGAAGGRLGSDECRVGHQGRHNGGVPLAVSAKLIVGDLQHIFLLDVVDRVVESVVERAATIGRHRMDRIDEQVGEGGVAACREGHEAIVGAAGRPVGAGAHIAPEGSLSRRAGCLEGEMPRGGMGVLG